METKNPQPQKSTKRKILGGIFNVVIYFVIVFGILFGLPKFLTWKLHTPYPMAAITSSSMWPALKEGELVFIQGVSSQNDIHLNDIIVFRNVTNNTLTIHRIVKIDNGKITTKGDANFSEDTSITLADVVGKTVNLNGSPLHIPYLGSVTVFANNLRETPKP